MRETFRIVALDEGGVRGTPDNRRLVCVLDHGGKLAIWGRDGARENIDKVLSAGLPCSVECEYRPPNEIQAEKYGHTHWVQQDFALTVLRQSARNQQ
jgi:hypothetical protein